MAGLARILVLEDDPEVRSALRSILEGEAYEVIESEDGADALAKLRAGPRPSVILLDLMMPGMNGWQFMDKVRLHPALRQVPIIVVSAYGSADGVRSVGATDYAVHQWDSQDRGHWDGPRTVWGRITEAHRWRWGPCGDVDGHLTFEFDEADHLTLYQMRQVSICL